MITPILLIYGPTASGKSALAVDLARRFDGEVINADSMQLYQGVAIITAQPDKNEQRGIVHHLYGHADPAEPGSVGLWLEQALGIIDAVRARGKVPIVAGGTGLYFEALTRGLAKIPRISAEARARADQVLQDEGMAVLRAEVARIDPAAAARIQGADRHRLLRVLSVYFETGRALSDFQHDTAPVLAAGSWCAMALLPERAWLYERIAARFATMLKAGALKEAQVMARNELPAEALVMKALGLKPLIRHLNGEISVQEVAEITVRDTRRYAKRQFTWASGRFDHWPVIDAKTQAEQQNQAVRIIEAVPSAQSSPAPQT